MSYVKFWAGFCEIKPNFKILLRKISSKCMKTYVGIEILQKSGLWKVLYGLATIFAVAPPNWRGAAAQLSAIFDRGLPRARLCIMLILPINLILSNSTK